MVQSVGSGSEESVVIGQEDISTMYPVSMDPPSNVDPYQASVRRSASLSEIKHYYHLRPFSSSPHIERVAGVVCDAGYLSMVVM